MEFTNLISAFLHAAVLAVRSGFVAVPVPVQAGVDVGVALRPEEVTEHASEVGNVGLGLKLEGSAVSEVFGELRWAALAESRNCDRLLLFHNKFVLLGGRLGLESLPWKASLEEVNQDVTDRLEIVTTRLLDTQVVIDGSVTGGTG